MTGEFGYGVERGFWVLLQALLVWLAYGLGSRAKPQIQDVYGHFLVAGFLIFMSAGLTGRGYSLGQFTVVVGIPFLIGVYPAILAIYYERRDRKHSPPESALPNVHDSSAGGRESIEREVRELFASILRRKEP